MYEYPLTLTYATLHSKGNLNLLCVYHGSITVPGKLRMFSEATLEAYPNQFRFSRGTDQTHPSNFLTIHFDPFIIVVVL